MKKGWQTKHLGDVAAVGGGNSAPQDEALFENGTIPFFRTADAGRVRFGDIAESTDYLNDKGVKGLRRFAPGTILFPKSGASTFLNHRVMLGVEGCVSSHLATIVADEKQAHPRFLLYFLSTIAAQDLVQDHAYPSLNLPTIAGIDVHLPPLAEQQRIVGLLDGVFEGLAIAKTNAEKNLQNARALFESHLQSVFTQRGPGWVKTRLGDICKTGSGGTPLSSRKEYYYDGDIPWLVSGEVAQGNVRTAKNFITKAGLENSSAKLFPKNTVLVAMYGATAGQVGILRFEAATNQAVCGILPNDKFVPEYIFYFFLAEKDKLVAQATGNAQPNISQIKIKNTEVPVASLAEQQRIVDNLDSLHAETQRLTRLYERKLVSLDELKKSLLHQAFNGELSK